MSIKEQEGWGPSWTSHVVLRGNLCLLRPGLEIKNNIPPQAFSWGRTWRSGMERLPVSCFREHMRKTVAGLHPFYIIHPGQWDNMMRDACCCSNIWNHEELVTAQDNSQHLVHLRSKGGNSQPSENNGAIYRVVDKGSTRLGSTNGLITAIKLISKRQNSQKSMNSSLWPGLY